MYFCHKGLSMHESTTDFKVQLLYNYIYKKMIFSIIYLLTMLSKHFTLYIWKSLNMIKFCLILGIIEIN